MIGHLAQIVRHPIKSIGWEELESVELTAGRILPFDRHWAVAHEAASFEGALEGWQPKRNFVRGVAGPGLMAVRARFDETQGRVMLSHPSRPDLEIAPDVAEDAERLLAWIAPDWPDNRPSAARVVTAGSQALTDVPDPFVSILSLSSLRALGQMMGQDLSLHRFRGNLWLDGFVPWQEFDWIGREIRIGGTRLRIEEPITRCNATKVDPATGIPDADTLGALDSAFGHQDFGVYASVLEGGRVSLRDPVELL